MKSFLREYFIFFYIFFIFGLSLIPGNGFIGTIHSFGVDKIIHFIEYFILGGLVHIFIKNRKKSFKILYILIVLVAIIDEYLIQKISNRTIDSFDFLSNFVGLYVGITVCLIIGKYFAKKTHN